MPKTTVTESDLEDDGALDTGGDDTSASPGADDAPALGAEDLAETDDLKAPKLSVRDTVAEVARTQAEKAGGGPATAPAHWKDDDKRFFGSITDQATKDFLVKRDKEYQAYAARAGNELTELKKNYEPIAQLFAPHADQLKRANQTPASVVQNYMRAEAALRSTPVPAILRLMNFYKVKPEQLVAALKKGGQAPETEAAEDEQIEVLPELKPFEDRLAKIEQAEQQRNERAMAEQTNQVNSSVTKFEKAVGKDGRTPLYPHATKPAIQKLMSIFLASNEVSIEAEGGIDKALAKAYDRAIRANDETHQELLSKAVEDNAKKAAEARGDRAKRARDASSSIGGGSSGNSATPAARRGSLREKLNEAATNAGFIG